MCLSTPDNLTGAVKQVDYAQHEIHEGAFWSNVQTVSVASTESAYLAVKAGSAKQPHVYFRASADTGPITFEIFVQPTVTAQGTSKAADTGNHNGTAAATAVPSTGPTVTADGKCTLRRYLGTKNETAGIRAENEVIPALDGYVICKVTNDHNITQNIVVSASWYEEAPVVG